MKWLSIVLALALSAAAQAQTYPTKTVRFVSGVTPGSASDTMARILAEKLSTTLGQPGSSRTASAREVSWARSGSRPRSPTATPS
jgi:tripartite-type tricarboxylate transporter receptor subunit TctC